MFKALMVLLAAFTLLDILVTKLGLGVGCVELNQFVTTAGLGFWTLLRMGLLGYMLAVFFAGYRLCRNRFSRGLPVLSVSLAVLNVYVGTLVFSGIFTILSKLLI